MKKLIIALSLFTIVHQLHAQQDAQYTQFFMNKLSFNPAYAGSEEKICVGGIYRSQWLGFGGANTGIAPTTFAVFAHTPIGQRIGLGLYIQRDELGFEKSINPMLSLAYRQPLRNGHTLAVGVSGGFMQKSLAGDKLDPLDDNDEKIPTQAVSGIGMDLNAGVYYTIPSIWVLNKVYAGLSATHLTQSNIQYQWSGFTANNPLKLHYYFTTGASYSLLPSIDLEPNVLVKSDGAKTSADINVMGVYNQKIKGGLTYRTSDAVAVLVGYQAASFYVGYSYDLTTSQILNYSSGSHEITARYCFMPKITPKDKPIVPRLTPRFL
jgi:type IX secretion system PorP/SprF family membrane protein